MVKAMLGKFYSNLMWPMLPNGIYCFNYHRIGDEATSQFDPNVFSCTAEQFEQHIKFYKAEFTVISVDELIIKINNNSPIDKKYAVITFDDGYIDNYSIAFPILKKHKKTGNTVRATWVWGPLLILVILVASCSVPDSSYQNLSHFSKVFNREKPYRIYLPSTYADDEGKEYPVVYYSP